jgi:fumarate hydratase class I
VSPDFVYSDILPHGPHGADGVDPAWRLVTTEGVSTFEANGRTFLQVAPEALQVLAREAMHDIAHYLRPTHLRQLSSILDDPQASPNDRFVALDLLRNANISAGGVLPMCQDTGTAIVAGKRGSQVVTAPSDPDGAVTPTPRSTCGTASWPR